MKVLQAEHVDDALLLLGRTGGALSELHPSERALLGKNATAKREGDLVGGRLLAKEALRRRFGAGDWIIGRDTGEHEGAPLVRGPNAAAHISISHVDGLCVAIASSKNVTVDLVKLEPLADSLCEEAFTGSERRAWLAAPVEHSMAHAFAAKEAALKWLRVGMGVPLHSVEVLPLNLATDSSAIMLRTGERCVTLACRTFVHEHAGQEQWLSFVAYERSNQ